MRTRILATWAIWILGILLGRPVWAATAVVWSEPQRPAIAFGANDLVEALRQKRIVVDTADPGALTTKKAAIQVVITTADASVANKPVVTGLRPQGYAIRRVPRGRETRLWVIGADATGAMYGALELAESVQIAGTLDGVTDRLVNPHLASRGIKFNIPLDARTPSYSDDSTSGQANIQTLWTWQFWTSFLDEMARASLQRAVAVESQSRFRSMVRCRSIPNVALTDVEDPRPGRCSTPRSRVARHVRPVVAARDREGDDHRSEDRILAIVMQYPRDRGVDVSLFTWNIFVYGTEGSGYGQTGSIPQSRPYEGLVPRIHAHVVQHVSPACGHRHHIGREHGRPRRRRQGAVDVGDLRTGA